MRVDAWHGLPYANVTSLALQRTPVSGATVLHVGTQAGLIAADVTPAAGTPAAPLPLAQWAWSYRYLQRWTPGEAVVAVAAHAAGTGSPYVLASTVAGAIPPPRFPPAPGPTGATAARGRRAGRSGRSTSARPPVFAARDAAVSGCGVALLEDQAWTLAAKAERIEAIQAKHDRYGWVC